MKKPDVDASGMISFNRGIVFLKQRLNHYVIKIRNIFTIPKIHGLKT
jgi:hypothetical protein